MAENETLSKKDEELIERWYQEVLQRHEEIDLERAMDFHDLAYGFFLGCGKTPNNAYELVTVLERRHML